MLVQPANLAGGSHLGLTCDPDEAPVLGPNNMAFATNAGDDDATVADSEDSDLEASFAWHDEETRLRYARLAARARAQELAYAQKLARQNEMENERARDWKRHQSRSRSRSRSNTRNPVFTGLFHRRERHASHGSASMSRPGTPTNEKTYSIFLFIFLRTQLTNQHSVTRSPLLKFIPIPRSGSSKSIHSSVSSQPASSRPSSPFSSPRTPLSPLPFFLTSRKRRASAVPGPGDDSVPQGLLEGSKGIGVPLVRVARRPSPARVTTPPIAEDLETQTAKPHSRTSQYPDPSFRTRRPSEPAAHADDPDEAAPHTPHLLFDGGVPLTRVERRRLPPRSQTIGT